MQNPKFFELQTNIYGPLKAQTLDKSKNKNSWQPMRRSNLHSKGPILFFLGDGGWGRGVFGFFLLFLICSHQVFILFSSCSQYVHQVFNVFPNMFPIATHFVPYALPKVLLLKLHKERRRLF